MVDLDAPPVEQQIQSATYIAAASFALLYYDYFMTLPLEAERFWAFKTNLVSALFYFNRYVCVIGHLPIIAQYLWLSSSRDRLLICERLSLFHQYLAVAIQVSVGLIFILRTYALYEQRRPILALLLIAGWTVIGFGVFCVASGPSGAYNVEDLPPTSCLLPVSHDMSRRMINAWSGMLAFDILIFFMTLYQCTRYRMTGVRSSIASVMFRDGVASFFIIMALCASVIASFKTSPTYSKGSLTIMTNTFSSLLMSRLQLNIRDPKRWGGRSWTTHGDGALTSVIMPSVLRSGTSLQFEAMTSISGDQEMSSDGYDSSGSRRTPS